ncbi:hypothetical protein YC2023_068277 [Brassica napus]
MQGLTEKFKEKGYGVITYQAQLLSTTRPACSSLCFTIFEAVETIGNGRSGLVHKLFEFKTQ